jgi:HEAT repeat protein
MVSHDNSDLEQAIESLLTETRPEVRADALLALSDRAGARLWPIIESWLESTNKQERLAAIVAAERTRCFHLEERLLLELAPPDARIAAAAAHAISTLGDVRTQQVLMRMLGVDKVDQ